MTDKIQQRGTYTGTCYIFDLKEKQTIILFVISIMYNYNYKWDTHTDENKQALNLFSISYIFSLELKTSLFGWIASPKNL